MIRSAWQIENQNDALLYNSEASLSAYVPFVLSSFQGKSILILSKCWWSLNHGECTWILRFMITILLSAVSGWLSQQSDGINLKIAGQENYLSGITARRWFVLNLKQTELFAAALAAPPIFPMLSKHDETQVLVSFVSICRLTGRNYLYSHLFSLLYSCEYAITAP